MIAPPAPVPPFQVVVRRRRLVLAAYLAVAAAFLPGIFRLEIDNAPERFFVQDARALERFRDLELTFGRDRAVRLVVPADGAWSREGLARLAALEAAAQDPARVGGGVYGSAGLHRQHAWHLDGTSGAPGGWPPGDPEAFRDLVRSDPLDREMGWVSRDGRYVTVLAGLYKMPRGRREATLAALEALLPDGAFAVGVAVVNRALDQGLADMFRHTFPLLLAVAATLLLAAFRGRAALLPLALAAVSQAVLFGAMGYAGERLDVVTMILLPLVFVIALATGVHVLAYHQRVLASGLGAAEAVLETYRVKAWPVFWTGATTCAGFASLAVSPVPPVRSFGLWAAFGIALLTLAALSFYPALLAGEGRRATGAPAGRTTERLGRAGGRLAALVVRRRRSVYAAFGVAALLAAAGLPRLDVETSVLTHLRPEHPVRARIVALEEAGVGTVSASLVVARPGGPSLHEADSIRRLAELAAALRDDPLVLGAVSPADLLAGVARRDPEPAAATAAPDPFAAARARTAERPELAPLLALVESSGGAASRVLLATPMRGHRELDPLYERAEALAARAFPDADVHVTGQYPLVLAAQRSLLRTMVLSLGLTLAVVAAILAGLLRSGRLFWRALVPNLWPVLLVLGAMGWAGVPIDSGTVMIAAVVLGLAVDDTLHTLGHFRGACARGGSPARAAVTTLSETAAGHATTSVVLALGFAACALSPLVSVARFGALAAVGVLGALAADLALVPALLGSTRPRSRELQRAQAG